jgi:hypothetical protein
MRHIPMKPTPEDAGRHEVIVTEKFSTGVCVGFPLMHTSAYPICRDFLVLLPKPLYHSLLHIVVCCKWSNDTKIIWQ